MSRWDDALSAAIIFPWRRNLNNRNETAVKARLKKPAAGPDKSSCVRLKVGAR